MSEVELHQAAFFTCDDCGRDTFVRLINVADESLSPEVVGMCHEELEEMRREIGPAGEAGGAFYLSPCRVTCDHCGAAHDVSEGKLS